MVVSTCKKFTTNSRQEMRSYRHLTQEERYKIEAYKQAGYKQYEIAREVGVDPSTVSRELSRNSSKLYHVYHAKSADQTAVLRRRYASRASNKKMEPELIVIIEDKLRLEWSPEQVAAWISEHTAFSVSHERIYQHVWQDKVKGGTLHRHLRHHGKRRKKYASQAQRGALTNRVSIEERPTIVDRKVRIGDLEADTIIGKHQKGAIATIVDRKSMYLFISNPTTKKAKDIEDIMTSILLPHKERFHTLTTDNGLEFANHQAIANALGIDYYFCHPYASWERGLNENINGLIRQYIPKGSSFDTITEAQIEMIAYKLNHRPRKSLNWATPYEVFHGLKAG